MSENNEFPILTGKFELHEDTFSLSIKDHRAGAPDGIPEPLLQALVVKIIQAIGKPGLMERFNVDYEDKE